MVVSQILLSPSVPISLCQSLHTDGNPASYFTKTIPHKNVQSFPNPQLLTSLHRCHIMSSLFRRQRWGRGTYTRTEHNKTWAIELIKTHIYKDSRALSPWIPKHFFSIHLYIRNLPLQKMCVPHVHWDDPILPPPPSGITPPAVPHHLHSVFSLFWIIFISISICPYLSM